MRSRRSRVPTEEQKTEFFDRNAPRPDPASNVEIGTPTEIDPVVDRSAPNPLRVISMKTPADLAGAKQQAKQHQVQIRSMSNVVRAHETPPSAQHLGRLAPPRDPREARARKVRDYVIWGCAVVILASIVMLAVWFIARR